MRKLALLAAAAALAALAACSVVFPRSVSARVRVTGSLFTDVTKRSGVRFRFHGDFFDGKFIPTMGGGVAAADFDGDGVLDLFFVQQVKSAKRYRKAGHGQPLADCARLFRGRGDGTFEDVTERSGIRACGWGVSAMWADLDADGFPDLIVGNAGEPPSVWRNGGDGTFAEVKDSGIEKAAGFTEGMAALDYDGDGVADVYLGHYVDTDPDRESKIPAKAFMTPDQYAGRDNTLMRGLGGWKFADVTKESGAADPGSKTIGAVAFDYDGDGRTDLYVANDQWRNTLFHNEGNGTFRDVSDETGTGYPKDAVTAFGRKTRSGMGLVAEDLDGDGRPDLFVTNYANEPNTLYTNVEGAMFDERDRDAFGAGKDPSLPLSGWGVVALDWDDDGREDLAVTNGQILPRFWTWVAKLFNPQAKNFDVGEKSYPQRQLLFRNESAPGAPRFRDVSAESGDFGKIVVVGRGLVAGDWDGDGKLDLAFNPIDHAAILLKNTAPGGRSLELLPVAGADRKTVLGTKVTVDGRTKSFFVVPSLASGSWLPLHFGLGARSEARVAVTWPDGTAQELGSLRAGAWRVRKGEAPEPLRRRTPRT